MSVDWDALIAERRRLYALVQDVLCIAESGKAENATRAAFHALPPALQTAVFALYDAIWTEAQKVVA